MSLYIGLENPRVGWQWVMKKLKNDMTNFDADSSESPSTRHLGKRSSKITVNLEEYNSLFIQAPKDKDISLPLLSSL